MTGLLALLREAELPERTVRVNLRGRLVAEYEELERQLKAATARPDDDFGGSGDAQRISEQMAEVAERMRGGEVVFRMRALGSERSAALIADHPPRPENDVDKRLGYNPATFYPARVRACTVSVERDADVLAVTDVDDETWSNLLGALSNKQFDDLFGAAWLLDQGDVSVPSSPLASLISQRAGESSKQPSAGESRRDGSQDGSRAGSRRSSGTKKGASSEK